MDLWRMLKENGEAIIQQLCTTQTVEGQRLEFKRKSSPDRDGLSDDDKRGLGESLSGFSNAEGGIVVFGIVGERGGDGLDYAKEIQPIANLPQFAGKITALLPSYLSPPNRDLETLAIYCNGQPQAGVLAVRIGQSESRPHMSLAPGHHKYFLRTQSSNVPMVDFQVRDMLRINTSPRLGLGYQLRPGAISGDTHQSALVLTLINEGRMSAYQPYIVVRPGTTIHPIGPGSELFQQFQLADVACRGYQGGGRLAIHPGHEVPAVSFLAHVRRISNEACLRLDANSRDFIRWDQCATPNINVSIGAEHTIAQDIVFSIDQAELERMADQIVLKRKVFHSDRRF